MRITTMAALLVGLFGCPQIEAGDTHPEPGDTGDTGTPTTGDPVLAICSQCVPEPGRPGAYRLQVFPPPDDWNIVNGQFADVGGAWVVDNESLGTVTTAYSPAFPLEAGWIMLEVETLASGMTVSVQQAPAGAVTATVFAENTSDATTPQTIEAGAIIGGTGAPADPYVFTGEHVVVAGVAYYGKVEGAYDATLVGYDLLFRVP